MNRKQFLKTLAAGAVALAFAPTLYAADAADVLKRASTAMGGDDLKTLVYSGSGMGSSYGQAYIPGMAWPKLNYSKYLRQVDYEKIFTSEEASRGRAEPKGGGAVPLSGEAPFTGVASATRAWQSAGGAPVARQAAHSGRIHDLWITPHGVIKAAMKANATAKEVTQGGRKLTAVSFTQPGIMVATAYINDSGMVERVESRMPDAVTGDTPVVTTYSDYRDHGGVKFPAKIEQKMAGSMTLDLNIAEVKPNAPVDASVPDPVANAVERVTSEKVADGVWFLAGGSHNSVAIEMKDHVVLVESPLGDERASAVFDTVYKLVPNKPVKYVVNSHNHFDHTGGLRAAAAEGATILTQAQSKAYYDKVFANPNRIAIDRLARSGRKAKVEGVTEKRTLKDATRTVELYQIKGSDHADTLLMAYLPADKLLIEVDLFTPGAPNAPAPAQPNAYHVNLIENIEKLKLNVDRILPLHGRVVPYAELLRMVGR